MDDGVLVAGWPGMGFLAKITVDYLAEELRAKPVAEIIVPQNEIVFTDGVGELLRTTHKIYHYAPKNLLILRGGNQPQYIEEVYALANKVLDIAQELNVRKVITVAAMPEDFDGEPKIFGIVNNEELLEYLKQFEIPALKGTGSVLGLNGVLIGVAAERNIEGICLMGQIKYIDIPQPTTARVVLRLLSRMLNLDISLSRIEKMIEEVEKPIVEELERRSRRVKERERPGYIS